MPCGSCEECSGRKRQYQGGVGEVERHHRQEGADPVGFCEADREVLAHPLDGEAEFEFVVDHGLPPVLHLPGLCRAFRDCADDRRYVQLGAFREMQGLGKTLQDAGYADLVDHLGQLTRARAADQRTCLRI